MASSFLIGYIKTECEFCEADVCLLPCILPCEHCFCYFLLKKNSKESSVGACPTCPTCKLTFSLKDLKTSLACIVCWCTADNMSRSATPFQVCEVHTASSYCTSCNLWLCDHDHTQEHEKANPRHGCVDITRMDLAEARFQMRCSAILNKVKLEILERHKECEDQLKRETKELLDQLIQFETFVYSDLSVEERQMLRRSPDCNIAGGTDLVPPVVGLPLVRFIPTTSVNMMGELNLGSTDGQTATPRQTPGKCYKDASTMPSSTKLGSSQTRKGQRLDDECATPGWNSTSDIKTADQTKSDGKGRRGDIAFSKLNAEAVCFVPSKPIFDLSPLSESNSPCQAGLHTPHINPPMYLSAAKPPPPTNQQVTNTTSNHPPQSDSCLMVQAVGVLTELQDSDPRTLAQIINFFADFNNIQ